MRKWLVRKIVQADTLKEALAKELTTEVLEVTLLVKEKDQLVAAIGLESSDHDYDEGYRKVGF